MIQHERLLSDYEETVKKITGSNDTISEMKQKPTTYAIISANLRKLRLKELREKIRRNESEIREIRREILAVRSGKRDERLLEVRARILGVETDEASKEDVDPEMTADAMKEKLLLLANKISNAKIAKVFRNPVSPEDVPNYTTIIKTPMDLSAILAKIEDGTIINRFQLVSAILLVCKNACTFNAPDTDIYNNALKLQEMTLDEADSIFGPAKTAGDNERTTRSKASRM